jgi:hypothetical protein
VRRRGTAARGCSAGRARPARAAAVRTGDPAPDTRIASTSLPCVCALSSSPVLYDWSLVPRHGAGTCAADPSLSQMPGVRCGPPAALYRWVIVTGPTAAAERMSKLGRTSEPDERTCTWWLGGARGHVMRARTARPSVGGGRRGLLHACVHVQSWRGTPVAHAGRFGLEFFFFAFLDLRLVVHSRRTIFR